MDDNVNELETEVSDKWRHLRNAAAEFWHAFTAWAKTRSKERLGLVDYDEDEPPAEESEAPQDSERCRPSCASSLFDLAILVTLALVVYFLVPPVRRVVNATVSATVNAVIQEASPSKQPTETSRTEEWWGHSLKTVMPQENRGEGFAAILNWLQIRRPELSLKQRLDEIDAIDGLITSEVKCILFCTERHKKADEPVLSIRATCLAGDPDSPWLIAAVGQDDLTSKGCTFAVSCDGKYYDLNPLNDDEIHKPERKTVEAGLPWLKAVDVDLDGSTEIIETWRADFHRVMHVQVHKLIPGFGWKRVMSFPDAWFGQIKIVRPRPGSAPQVLIAEGVGSERGGREIIGYLVSVYAWDRKLGTLAKKSQYVSHSEFDPLKAGAERPIVAKTLPNTIKVQLDKSLTHGWICTSAKGIYGHLILTVYDADRPQNATVSWILVVDPGNRVILAASGATYMPGGLERIVDLDGDGFLEAVVTSDGGGAHGNLEYYVCAFHPRFRLLACIRAGRSGINEIKDLDYDGKKEIMLGDDSFANFDDLPCANTPTLPMVLGYRDSMYVGVTARYPDIVHADIAEARSLLRQMISSKRREPIEAYDTSARDSLAIEWLADAAIIGEEDEAYAEIARLTPEDLRHWLSENRAKIISVVHTRCRKLSYRAPTFAEMTE